MGRGEWGEAHILAHKAGYVRCVCIEMYIHILAHVCRIMCRDMCLDVMYLDVCVEMCMLVEIVI